ncbi:MAG: helix-turn-helix transcriptional regulator [Marmoricola sp.]
MTSARDQVARMLALVPYLQRGQDVSLRTLADEFGVTPEQMRRDLSTLWMCGLPGLGGGDLIDLNYEAFEHDPDGLVRLENAEYLSRPLRLGSTEASALIVALGVLRDSSPEASREVVDRVLAKLAGATADAGPGPLAVHAEPSPERSGRTREALERAVAEDRQVRLTYFVPSRDETTERVVDPLVVQDQDGQTYLDAWCHLVDGRRLFRLDRVDEVEVLESPRARGQEPPRELGDALFEPDPDALTARIRLHRRARWLVDFHPVETVVPGPEDSLDVTLRVADPRWLVRLVLGRAPDAEVLGPPELAAQVRDRAAAALALYDDLDLDPGPGA